MAYGRISEEDLMKIREATDLVSLVGERAPLRQKGREFWCCCPLHHEKTPSFKIDPAAQLWHCFGCDAGGDVFGFIMAADELSFPEAAMKLAERAHIEIASRGASIGGSARRNRLKEASKAAAEFFHMNLMRSKSPSAARAREYLAGRGLGGDVPKEWNLGFAPGGGLLISNLESRGFTRQEMLDANLAAIGKGGKLYDRFFNRVMFPINDVSGDVIAFGGRALVDKGPKYLNSQETAIFRKSQVLYGLDKAKAQMALTGTAIVAEGYTDVIALHRAGLANSVAALGTALTKDHIRQLVRHAGRRIVYLFDGDEAGQRATERALKFIDESITPESGRSRMDLRALTLPDGLDPAEFIEANGADAMRRKIQEAQPLILFGIERRLAKHDRGSAEGRAAALSDALDVLAPIKDSILAKDYAVQIASILHFREDDVLAQLARLKKPPAYGESGISGTSGRAWSGNRADATGRKGQSQYAEDDASAEDGVYEMRSRISIADKSRLDLEREFLGLIAQNPISALSYADAIEKVKWRKPEHMLIADSILGTLMNDLSASPAKIVEEAKGVCGSAGSILTSARSHDRECSGQLMEYISEELAIGDLEDEIGQMRCNPPRDKDAAQSSQASFEDMIALQLRLAEMKSRHVKLP